MILSEILSTYLDKTLIDKTLIYKRTADILSYKMIYLFPKPLWDFLSVLDRRTRERKVYNIIYISTFFKLMHDQSNTLQV